jgi:hypothetical protein
MADRVTVGSNTHPVNPTPLSAPQEQQVRDLYYKNVRAKCAEEIESAYNAPSRMVTINCRQDIQPQLLEKRTNCVKMIKNYGRLLTLP